MALIVELGVADLAATRFAASPLCETVKAIQLLASNDPDRAAVNQPWLTWARRELERSPVKLPYAWPLVITRREYYPEFVIPAPRGQWPTLTDELDRLRATRAEDVRGSLNRVFGSPRDPWPETITELARDPNTTLKTVAAEFEGFHDRLIAPYWERIRSVLDADIAYRTALLASGGARGLFRDLHSRLHWSAGTLTIGDQHHDPLPQHVNLGPDGLVLMPSVFTWPEASVSMATSTQTVLMYPARGAGTVWLGREPERATAAALIGEMRARLLGMLRSPASTTALARALGVTPGAVSQHLAVLHQGGLVTRQRAGRSVLYQTSDLGLAFLAGKLR